MNGETRALTNAEAVGIHDASLERFGGLPGVRDEGLLESALAQPYQSAFGEDLYPTIEDRAARLCYGIAKNHPFLDGNKRTACACMGTYLRMNGRRFRPEAGDLLSTMLSVASGAIGYDELAAWVRLQA